VFDWRGGAILDTTQGGTLFERHSSGIGKAHLITSGETLARILPQMTSGLRAAGISDRHYGSLCGIYRAFRRRRSLLLLNLEKQIQIEELRGLQRLIGIETKISRARTSSPGA